MVRLHRLAPVAQTGDSLRGLHGALVVEVGGIQVGVEELARLVVDLFLGEGEQRVEEVVSHHGHRDVFPVFGSVDDNLVLLGLVPRDLLGHGILPEHQHGVEDALDEVGRVLERLCVLDALLVDGAERFERGVHGGLRQLEILLSLNLTSLDLVSLGRDTLDDDSHLCLLLLGDGGGRGDLLEELLGRFLSLGEILVLLRELNLHLLHVALSLEELGQTAVDLVREDVDVVQLLLVEAAVSVDEGEVRLGGDVDVSPELFKVLLASRGHRGVHVTHVLLEQRLDGLVARHVEVTDELGGHRDEGVLGPREEPVDGAPVDETREISSSSREFVANRGEAEARVEVVPHPTQEELVEVLPRVGHVGALTLGHGSHVVDDHVELILGEETRHLASHQNLVDELEEGFLLDLGVGEDERNLLALQTRHLVQRLEILEQRALVVLLRDCNLERERSDDVRGQSGQRLLTRPSHAHQQRATSVHAQKPRDAHHVRQRVGEQHQVKLDRLGRLVERGHLPIREVLHHLKVNRGLVKARVCFEDVARLIVDDGGPQKVHKVHALLNLLRDLLAERVADDLLDQRVGPVLVVVRRELVHKDALALVPPERHQVPLGGLDVTPKRWVLHAALEPVALGEDQALEHLAELAHVEQVVELGGGWEHLGLDLVPEVDGDRHQLLGGGDDVGGEHVRREASGDELTEDVVDGRHGRKRHVEDAEVPLQTVGNIVLPAPRRVHRREVLHVDNHLHVSDGFLERVHAALFQELPDNLVGHLVTPVVHLRHGDVVDEHDELLARGRAERSSLSLLNSALHRCLEHPRRGE
mmetsp:Transcript_7377/g.32658  ORF Transcript_7377/g.32658 Transcript_7377/m.32658 type:complete len:813 (-) Transcript_7377:1941-4379(-)